MRNYLLTLLICILTVLPVQSVLAVCASVHVPEHRVEQSVEHDVMPADHHCCLESMQHVAASTSSSPHTCHCDHVQHAQFVPALMTMPLLIFSVSYSAPVPSIAVLSEQVELLYRPPIA